MTTHHHNEPNGYKAQPIVSLQPDERDVLISRVIDGVATSEDWSTFRAAAAHDPTIWSELADTQRDHESMCMRVHQHVGIADQIELPTALFDDQPLRHRLEMVSKWGGWAAAAAILLVWFIGNPAGITHTEPGHLTGGLAGSGLLLTQSQPDQAFNRYLDEGQRTGRVVGEMPEQIVIETRPMQDGTIEVLYLRQIIERQIINHAYRPMIDESGNSFPVPVKMTPMTTKSY